MKCRALCLKSNTIEEFEEEEVVNKIYKLNYVCEAERDETRKDKTNWEKKRAA